MLEHRMLSSETLFLHFAHHLFSRARMLKSPMSKRKLSPTEPHALLMRASYQAIEKMYLDGVISFDEYMFYGAQASASSQATPDPYVFSMPQQHHRELCMCYHPTKDSSRANPEVPRLCEAANRQRILQLC